MKQHHPETVALTTPYMRPDAYGALSMPVYNAVAYEFPDSDTMVASFTGRSNDPDYSRVTNPTVIHYENVIKALTGARDVVAFNSGMAAIANAMMALGAAGKNVVASPHVFGNTYLLLTETLRRFGMETRLVDLSDEDTVAAAIDGDTCCVYLEAITNPQLEAVDLRRLSRQAHEKGVPLVVDTTAVPFTEFDGKALGIDMQVLSSTKYISGGATSLGGLIIDHGTVNELNTTLRRELLLNLGAYLNPHAAYMQTLGLETLGVRYRRQSSTALDLARRLEKHPAVKAVGYPGLDSHRSHAVATALYGPTPGAMLTFELEDEQACRRFIDRLQLWRRATNLFDNRSLAIHPYSTIFGTLTPAQRASMHVLPTTIRLSAGLEHPDDLWADLSQALSL